MKPLLRIFILVLFGFNSLNFAEGGASTSRNWEEDVSLKKLKCASDRFMKEYASWSMRFHEEKRPITESDRHINRLAEAFFLHLWQVIGETPNPSLALAVAEFLDRTVPPAFDDTWSFIFIEWRNVSRDENRKQLDSRALENLRKRAMRE